MKYLKKPLAAMKSEELRELLLVAGEAALAGGKVLRELYGRPHQVRHKGAIDLITEADVAAEEAVLKVLSRKSGFAVLSEESRASYEEVPAGPVWIVDPLDGTTNFAHHFPWFAVSVGLFEQGRGVVGVIYAPLLDEFFCAARGAGAFLNGEPVRVSAAATLEQALLATGFPYDVHSKAEPVIEKLRAFLVRSQGIRRAGAAALDLAYVACGRLDGFWESNLKPWDTAAGMLLVEEAGGVLSGFGGQPFSPFVPELVAGNRSIQQEMVKVLIDLAG